MHALKSIIILLFLFLSTNAFTYGGNRIWWEDGTGKVYTENPTDIVNFLSNIYTPSTEPYTCENATRGGVFFSDLESALYYCDGLAWLAIGSGSGGGISPWISGTEYIPGTQVYYSDYLIYLNIVGNSDLTFDPTKWQELSSDNRALSASQSTAIIEGCEILPSTVGKSEIDIDECTFRVVDNYTDPFHPVVNIYTKTATTIPITNIATQDGTVVTLDKFGNYQAIATEPPSSTELRDNVLVGVVVHISRATVELVDDSSGAIGYDSALALMDWKEVYGPVNYLGNVFTASASSMELNKTAGTIFGFGINQKVGKKSQNFLSTALCETCSWLYLYRDPAEPTGWATLPSQTLVDGGQYDDGTGTLSSVIASQYTIQRFYQGSSGVIIAQYGQETYSSLGAAEDAVKTGDGAEINPSISNATLIAWIVIKGNDTTIQDSQIFTARPNTAGGGSSNVTVGGLSAVAVSPAGNPNLITGCNNIVLADASTATVIVNLPDSSPSNTDCTNQFYLYDNTYSLEVTTQGGTQLIGEKTTQTIDTVDDAFTTFSYPPGSKYLVTQDSRGGGGLWEEQNYGIQTMSADTTIGNVAQVILNAATSSVTATLPDHTTFGGKFLDISASNLTNQARIVGTFADGRTEYVFNAVDTPIGLAPAATGWMIQYKTNYIDLYASSEWEQYTPTTQGFGTITNVNFFWKRDGDSIDIMGRFRTGTISATEAQFGLPSGLTISATKAPTVMYVGDGTLGSTSSSQIKSYAMLATGGDSFLNFGRNNYHSVASSLTPQNGNALTSATEFGFRARVPIEDWKDTNDNVVTTTDKKSESAAYSTVSGRGSVATRIPYFATELYDTTDKLISVTNDSTNGFVITALEDVTINTTYTFSFSSATVCGWSYQKSGTTVSTTTDWYLLPDGQKFGGDQNGASNQSANPSVSMILRKGDVLRPHTVTVGITQTDRWSITVAAQPLAFSETLLKQQTVRSSDEQIVGTWIDGSTLYERSWDLSGLSSGITVIDAAFTSVLYTPRNNWTASGGGTNWFRELYFATSTIFVRIGIRVDGLKYETGTTAFPDTSFTVQYTKN